MRPLYRIGQLVRRTHRAFAHEPSGFGDMNEIVAFLPPDDKGLPRYQIQTGYAVCEVSESESAATARRPDSA